MLSGLWVPAKGFWMKYGLHRACEVKITGSYRLWDWVYPLVMTNTLLLKIAIEIVDFPINSMVIFPSVM